MNIDPNLIAVSKCGKYVYPVDSISGAKTFAPIDYFKKNVETKYGGSIERFVKEYVTRETKKYLKEGWSPEEIREQATKSKNGKLPKLDKKPKKDPNAPKKERRKRLSAHANSTQIVTNEDGTQEKVVTYPWSVDPTGYFKTIPVTLNISEITRDTCLRPDIYLEDECYNCSYYEQCQCPIKHKKK
jgi:hypothetical protein